MAPPVRLNVHCAVPLMATTPRGVFSSGSGFLITPTVVVTAWHNVERHLRRTAPGPHHSWGLTAGRALTFQLEVVQEMSGARVVPRRVLAARRSAGVGHLALLRLAPQPTRLVGLGMPVTLSRHPSPGDEVFVVGYTDDVDTQPVEESPIGEMALGFRPLLMPGVVTEIMTTDTQSVNPRRSAGFWSDADYRHGLSGAPVFNEQGAVCGVVSHPHFDQDGVATTFAASLAPIVIGPIRRSASQRIRFT